MEKEREMLVEALAAGFLDETGLSRVNAERAADALDAYLAARVAKLLFEAFGGRLRSQESPPQTPPTKPGEPGWQGINVLAGRVRGPK